MAEKKEKKPVYSSPKGVARYPFLNKPSVKFNPDGMYQVTLVLKEGEPATTSFLKKLDEFSQAAYDAKCEEVKTALESKGKKSAGAIKSIIKCVPYKKEMDEDGNETGNVLINFKQKAKVKSKKTGKEYTFEPKLFDCKNKELPTTVQIYGGSIIKVGFNVNDYWMAGDKKVGITLQIKGVQVIVLGDKPVFEADASEYGFDEEEEGFAYSESAMGTDLGEDGGEDGTDGEEDGEDGNEDF